MLVWRRGKIYNEGMSAGPLYEPPAPLRLPQFGLRTMFLAVAALGLLFALMGLIGPLASSALVLLLAMVGLHVAGNVVGTTLRDNAPVDPTDHVEKRPATIALPVQIERDLPPPRLSQSTGVSRMNRLFAGMGAVAGGAVGAAALECSTAISVAGVIVGYVSAAVLGAFFGFLLGCFLEMALSAWWQAASETESLQKAAALHIPLPSFPRNVTPELVAEFDAG